MQGLLTRKPDFAAEIAEPDYVCIIYEHQAHSHDNARLVNYKSHERHQYGSTDNAGIDDTGSSLSMGAELLEPKVEDKRPHYRMEQTCHKHAPNADHAVNHNQRQRDTQRSGTEADSKELARLELRKYAGANETAYHHASPIERKILCGKSGQLG